MSGTGAKLGTIIVTALFGFALLCVAPPSFASSRGQRKAAKPAKKAELPPLPSGPTGPVQQVPLDSIAAVAPQVTFQNNQLTINAPNSTLADILRAVRKQTGAEIEVPSAPERVVTHLGPGPARSVVAELLNGSRFNYVLLGSPSDDAVLTRVVLVPKSGMEGITPMGGAPTQPGFAQAAGPGQQPQNPPDMSTDSADDTSANDDNPVEPPPAAEPEQASPGASDQNTIKTPQQLLQEMQQRQMQLQQQQQQGVPGSGMPPHPPQQQ